MTVTYTFDIFSSLDGYASYREPGDCGGNWGKQGPSCSTAAPPCTAATIEWSSEPTPSRSLCRCSARVRAAVG